MEVDAEFVNLHDREMQALVPINPSRSTRLTPEANHRPTFVESLPSFTPPAAKLWSSIPAEARKRLLVGCSSRRKRFH